MNSHRQGNKNLVRSSYSGSFKVMHLGPLKSCRRAVYTALYILYIISIVSVFNFGPILHRFGDLIGFMCS